MSPQQAINRIIEINRVLVGSMEESQVTEELMSLLIVLDDHLCSVDGCSNQKYSKGFCRMHYVRNERYGSATFYKRGK